MSADVNKLAFSSEYPIDKIVASGTVQVVNDGATSNSPQTAKIVTSTITNPYGKKCFARAIFSVDGTNFSPLTSHLVYTFTLNPGSVILSGLKAGCSVGVSTLSIFFRTANGFHGNASLSGATYTYTPTSLTFTIKYALFEVS